MGSRWHCGRLPEGEWKAGGFGTPDPLLDAVGIVAVCEAGADAGRRVVGRSSLRIGQRRWDPRARTAIAVRGSACGNHLSAGSLSARSAQRVAGYVSQDRLPPAQVPSDERRIHRLGGELSWNPAIARSLIRACRWKFVLRQRSSPTVVTEFSAGSDRSRPGRTACSLPSSRAEPTNPHPPLLEYEAQATLSYGDVEKRIGWGNERQEVACGTDLLRTAA